MAPPKRPWFRFYVEMFTDAEMRALSPAQRWVWAAVLGLARTSPVAGALLDKAGEPVTDGRLADFAAVRPKDVTAALERFTALGMVTRSERAIVVEKWDVRQFESDDVATRVAKHRATKGSNGDVTPDGGGDVTADAPPDVTVSPSVVLTEIQRTEVLTSSSSEPVSRPGGPEEKDLIGSQVWALLAQHDAETFSAKGGTIKSRAWFVTAADTRRMAHERQLAEFTEEHADWTAAQLAQAIIDAGSGLVSQDDKAVAAMRARIGTNERRRRGEACPACDDRGVVELEDGTVEKCRCKSLRSA